MSQKDKILVTGASGFIAGHIIIDLLKQGYQVRGTIRDLVKVDKLRAMFALHTDKADSIEFVAATLTDADCWAAAVEGCDAIFHIASPVPLEQPKNPDEVVIPARDGALNVLKAAHKAGISRIIMTSSVAAVSAHADSHNAPQTEANWSDVNLPKITPYSLSKTIAEKAAWDYVESVGTIKLTTVQPALVLGPALEADYGSSLEALMKLLRGDLPMVPKLGFGIVDVRDVAELHRIAFENDESIGKRLLCSNGFRWFSTISAQLIEEFPAYKKKLPTKEMPYFLVRVLAIFDKVISSFIDDIGKEVEYDCSTAKALGWQPRTPEEAISAGAKSLIDLKVV
ncbi:MAG: dihydroflavonol-4-reductase [Candidatus Azotimanducaceae bacterium]|jgi:dihydroflavonol-4-reductase